MKRHGIEREQAHSMRTPEHKGLKGMLVAGMVLGLACGVSAQAAPLLGDSVVRVADEREQVRFVLTLPLQHQDELNTLVQRLYTPGDALYRHFLSSAEFDARFAPTQSQYDTLKSLAGQFGLSVVGEHGSRTVLDVQASAATIRNVLGSRLSLLRQADGRQYFAPDREPVLPFVLSAIGAEAAGLNGKPLSTHLRIRGAATEAEVLAAAQPHAGTQSSGSYAPADVKTAYNLNSIQNGGQAVALYELSTATYTDAATYASKFGLNNPSLVQVAVDGGTTDTSGATEVMLDIEMVMAVSNPSTMYVYTGPNSASGAIDTYTKIASDNLVGQVSTSWGLCESSEGQSAANAENTQFTKMVAQGMALFAAAGDSGAYDCGRGFLGLGGSVAVDDPAAQPNVTGVGGTSLTTTSTQAYTSESVWNTSSTEGGGGGISTFWAIPSYQQGVVFNGASGQFSTTKRNVPDVAMDADPATGFYVYDSKGCGGWCVVGGTSDGSPQWAAFWSLIGKGLANAGHSPARAGFANALIYPIGKNGAAYAADFHDLTTGNNNNFNAYAGYDDATGWGSYNGAKLYAAVISAVTGGGSSSSSSSSSSSGGSSSSSSSSSSGGGSSSSSSSSSSGGSSSSSSSSSGGSSSSSGGVTVPAAPTGLTATGTNSGLFQGALKLSWTASAGATSYKIYLGTTAGGESTTPSATVTGTSTTIGALNAQTKYYVKLKAVNSAGSSPYSAEASATTGGL
ncbi:MAG TPA: protease pro-enzyme activation domain-containing protein [Nevskia sp.]|nr:protease pro-enzyme activation domain-containing protein [Nevskia sp.]